MKFISQTINSNNFILLHFKIIKFGKKNVRKQICKLNYKVSSMLYCTAENQQFIEKILQMGTKKVKQLLDSEDEKYIIRKKQQIIRNMPQVLKPQQSKQVKDIAKTIYNTNIIAQNTKGNETKITHFPSNFQQKSRSNLLKSIFEETKLFKSDFQNVIPKANNSPFTFETGIKGQFMQWKGQTLREKLLDDIILDNEIKQEKIEVKQEIKQREIAFDTEKDISFKRQQQKVGTNQQQQPKLTQENPLNESGLRSSQSSQKPKEATENPFIPPAFQQSKNSPFISNKTNFLDLHTNKKTISGSYLSPDVYSMNMLQYAHNKKRQNTFDDRYSYPNVIMGGSGSGWMKTAQEMRENPFQTTFVAGLKAFGNTIQSHYQQDLTETKLLMKAQADNRFKQNVKDTLKYTLGDRRYTPKMPDRINEERKVGNSINKEVPLGRTKVLQNPFVRRPSSTYKK